jgi:molybdopterin molybdotransferase
VKRHLFGRLTPIQTARRRLLVSTCPVDGTEWVPVGEAPGRVAARAVRSPTNVPAFSRATWDGYALRSSETRAATPATPVRLRVVGEIFAEGRHAAPLGRGEAVAIATGGAVPAGADGVLIFEDARARGRSLTVERPVAVGERVAPPGSDFRRGARLLDAGDVIDPAAAASVGSTGQARVRVFRRPVVTLLPNGNELLLPGAPPEIGRIYETNNIALAAVARSCGAEVRCEPPVPDDPATITRALRRAADHSDIVLATGGSSVGERDYLAGAFRSLGPLLFHGIAVRPGKPTLAARRGHVLLVGMPGHPTSCLLNAYWLLLPCLLRAARRPGPGWTDRSVTLAAPVRPGSPDLATVVPLRVVGENATPTFRDSSAITSLVGANAFTILGPGAPSPSPGDRIVVQLLLPPVMATA